MKKLFSLTVILLAGLILLSSCVELGLSKKVKYPASVTNEMESAFNSAEKSYAAHDYEKALSEYQSFLSAFPYNKLSDESIYKIGKIHFIQKNWGGVIDAMNQLKDKSPDPMYKSKAGLMAAYSCYKNTDYQSALRWLADTKDTNLPDKLRLRYYSLQILSGEQLGIPRDQIDYNYLRLNDLFEASNDVSLNDISAEDVVKKSDVTQKIDSWIISPMTPESVPAWFASYPNGASKGFVEYKWGKVYYESQNVEKAKKKLIHFLEAYPKNRFAGSAKKLLDNLGQAAPATASTSNQDTLKIGVLLPVTGVKASYGEAALKGIRCAAGQFEGCADLASKFSGSYTVELVVKDSGTTPEMIASQIEELQAQNCSAIIGPMSASLAVAAAQKAEALHIPVFPITQKTDLMKVGNNVFQMGFEVMTQVNLIVKEVKAKGVKSVAIFYPNNAYGTEMTEGFVKVAVAAGLKITSKVSYGEADADLTEAAHKLKTSVSRIEMGTNNLGFGAVFIPDSFASMGRIISAFEANSITGIPLLGTTAWNDPRLPVGDLQKYNGSFYIDLFDLTKSSSLTTSFVNAMKTANGKPPTSIEALGFDALWAIRVAAQQKASTDKDKIREGLIELVNLDGVTGISAFRLGQGPAVNPSIIQAKP